MVCGVSGLHPLILVTVSGLRWYRVDIAPVPLTQPEANDITVASYFPQAGIIIEWFPGPG